MSKVREHLHVDGCGEKSRPGVRGSSSGHTNHSGECPLSVKRTWLFALQMSAFDPKRTFIAPDFQAIPPDD